MSKKQFAFTLIELLVVIAIIGILSSLIVVSMSGVTDKANIAKAQVFSNSLRNSLMLNLVSEWKLDGDTNDSWSGGNNGTANGAIPISSGCVQGTCYGFDGNDYIDYGTGSNLNAITSFSESIWIKPTVLAGNMGGIGKYWTSGQRSQMIQFGNAINYAVLSSDGTVLSYNTYSTAVFSLAANVWKYLVMTYDGSALSLKLYANGVLLTPTSTTGTIPSSIKSSSDSFKVGVWSSNGGTTNYYFTGSIDEVRFFNAALPTSQIKEQYFIGLNKLFIMGQINNKEYQQRLAELENKTARE